MYRLGNMVLMQGKEGQIDRLTEYGRRRDRVLLRADSCRFPLTKQIADFNECTPAMLEYRQKETIRLLAEYWDIRYDESHADLTSKPRSSFPATQAPGRRAVHSVSPSSRSSPPVC